MEPMQKTGGSDAMVDELKGGVEPVEGAAERIEAGMEEQTDPAQIEMIQLRADKDQLRGEKDQLIERLARLQAEFDNARKRAEKERSDAREYTVGSTVDPFLSVMDNFQLALKADGSADQLRSGGGFDPEADGRGAERAAGDGRGDGWDTLRSAHPRGAGKHRNG